MALQLTEVDGVPTLVAPTAGQTVAGLVFRVGRADETLARSGITHLIEHLALHPLGLTDHHYNGTTGPEVTSFHTAGSPEDVATFLNRVCESLGALPMQRLEAERSIVRTEWSSRTTSVYNDLPLWRYGARGWGLLSYDEPGTHAITAAELEEWTRTWFTRENAVLWVAGEIPPGLRLRLPSGRRMPLPEPTSALPQAPAWFTNDSRAVIMDAVVRRSSAASIYTHVLERTLFRELRQESGLSYSVAANYENRGDGYATVTAGVDALPEQLDAALGGFIDVLAQLRVGRIEEGDLAAYTAKLREHARHPDAEAGILGSTAFELLTDQPTRDLEQRVAEVNAVTVADVHAVAQEVAQTLLLGVPPGRSADWAGFAPAPTSSTVTVPGHPHQSRESVDLRLFVGADGIMLTREAKGGEPVHATVRFDQTAAMFAWPDGARRLVGYDAVTVVYEPTLWHSTPELTAHLDASVPPNLVVRMPARDPQHIPQPDSDSPARGGGGGSSGTAKGRRWTGWELAGLIISLVLGSILLCFGSLFSLVVSEETGGPEDVGWGVPIATFACMAVFYAPAVYLLIRRRR